MRRFRSAVTRASRRSPRTRSRADFLADTAICHSPDPRNDRRPYVRMSRRASQAINRERLLEISGDETTAATLCNLGENYHVIAEKAWRLEAAGEGPLVFDIAHRVCGSQRRNLMKSRFRVGRIACVRHSCQILSGASMDPD